MTIFGILTMILGVLVLLMPAVAGEAIFMAVGILVLLGGIVGMVRAFGAEGTGAKLLMFGFGILTVLCGAALLANPLFAATLLTILLVIYFLASGIVELASAFTSRPEAGRGWLLFGGVLSILLGVMMWGQSPFSGVLAVGVLLGVKLIMAGLIMITVRMPKEA